MLLTIVKNKTFLNCKSPENQNQNQKHLKLKVKSKLNQEPKAFYSQAQNSVKILTKDSIITETNNVNRKAIVNEANLKLVSTNTNKTSRVRLTLMLMTFPITYLITTLPLFIIITCQLISHYLLTNSKANFENEFAIFKTLMFFNNSFNILFFILFGKSLRKDMYSLFVCFSRRSEKYSNYASKASFTLKSNNQTNFNNNTNNICNKNQSPKKRAGDQKMSLSTKCSPLIISHDLM